MEYINIYYLIQNGELYSNDNDISNHMYATQKDVELYRQYMSALSKSKATKAVNKIFSFEFSFQSTISFFYKTILLKLFESHIHKENI